MAAQAGMGEGGLPAEVQALIQGIAPLVDSGSALPQPAQYRDLIRAVREHGHTALAALNTGLPLEHPRVLYFLPDWGALTVTNAIERGLVPVLANGRKGLIVVLRAEDDSRKRKRARTLPAGINYAGDSFGGRETRQPAQAPRVLKRYANWRRQQRVAVLTPEDSGLRTLQQVGCLWGCWGALGGRHKGERVSGVLPKPEPRGAVCSA